MKTYHSIRLLFFVSLAVLVGVFAIPLAENLKYLVGSLMILYGLEGFLLPIIRNPRKIFHEASFFSGVINILLGVVVIAAVEEYSTVCIIWACWTIVREGFEFYEMAEKFIEYRYPMVISFIESVVEIVFSIMLILHPHHEHALIHVYLLIAEFAVNGFSPCLFHLFMKKKGTKEHSEEE